MAVKIKYSAKKAQGCFWPAGWQVWGSTRAGNLRSRWPICDVYGSRRKALMIVALFNRHGQTLPVGCNR